MPTHINEPVHLIAEEMRLIIDEPASGACNMATDEACLESVGSGYAPPLIRLYRFEPATLSIGRFQKSEGILDFAAIERDGIDFVRRPSAGQAVLHTDELTYCVVIGKHHLSRFGKRDVYRFIVPLLLEGLEEIGLDGLAAAESQRGIRDNPDCFASTGEYEIDSADNRKLIGSAQMISRHAVLQHGSIPLGPGNRDLVKYLLGDSGTDRAAPTDELRAPSNVSREIGHPVDFETARQAFSRAIGRLLPITPGSISDSERELRDELIHSKYRSPAWNRKR